MNTIITRMSALLLALVISLPVAAMSLDDAKRELDAAKQQGLVGETPLGYLDVVKPEGNAKAIVDAINQARREEYARIAAKHNIPVAEVEAVAGKKAVEKTPSGQFIRVNGRWVQK
ncbi:MAG TPA: YdbL family protein [Marinobacter sp.]|jgi:uncharacterized protein YdbL (DUF1318 family)|nr:YdbL family protein [Marinobacter sp.]